MFASSAGQDKRALCLFKGIEIFSQLFVGVSREEPGGKQFVMGSGFEEGKKSCKVKKRTSKKRTFPVKMIYILDVDRDFLSISHFLLPIAVIAESLLELPN